jgi:hypothetical protein
MKKILIATNVLFFGIIAFQACNSKQSNKATNLKVDSTISCSNQFCNTNIGPFELQGLLDVKIIRQLSLSYAGDAGKQLINGIENSPDALSVVFDIEKLKNLICVMQNEACENSCDTSIELGIRFYFIKYPPDLDPNSPRTDGLGGLPSDNSNKHSLVMVPVYKYKNKKGADWYDYDLWVSKMGDCFPAIDTNVMHVAAGGGIIPNAGDNHGGIGPPPGTGIFPTNR